MRKFKTPRSRALRFRSLLFVAALLLFTAAIAPKANATVLIYFNFEDAVLGGPFDPQSDDIPPLGDNPGGGVQHSTLTTTFATTAAVAGTLINRTAGDIDIANPSLAIGMRTTASDNGGYIQFGVNATLFSNMSLSFAANTAGNGFNNVAFSYSTDGGANFTGAGSHAIASGGGFQIITFAVPASVDEQSNVVLRMTFNGGTSHGNNLQTVIDNIQLTGAPEPTTVVGGVLGVLGLCWHQRRRLIRSVRVRRSSA